MIPCRDRSRRAPASLACLFALGLASALGSPTARAAAPAAPDMNEVIDRVQSACSQVRDLWARFHQTATNRSLGQVREASGLFLVKRPGKMRWAYSPNDKQVVVQDLGEALASRAPLSFLAGDCQLRREFAVASLENAGTRASPGVRVLDLKPLRETAGIARVLLEVNLQSFLVEKSTLFDAAGNTTIIALTDIKLNSGLGDQQFHFAPPPGVTVVTPPNQ